MKKWFWKSRYLFIVCLLATLTALAVPEKLHASTDAGGRNVRFDHSNERLGNILRTLMAHFGRNIVFGADVDGIPVSLQIETASFEEIIFLIEIAANVEVTQIGRNSYSVRTLAEAQRIRDFENMERNRIAGEERAARDA